MYDLFLHQCHCAVAIFDSDWLLILRTSTISIYRNLTLCTRGAIQLTMCDFPLRCVIEPLFLGDEVIANGVILSSSCVS